MKIKFNNVQFKLLTELLEERGKKDILRYLNNHQSLSVDLDESVICDIRELVGDRLQIVGFDKNYELTKEGKILEEIIDTLYI